MREDTGSSTVLVLASIVALVVVATAALVVGDALVARARAASAADLSALAGAVTATKGGDACDAARQWAAQQNAALLMCEQQDGIVRVEVGVASSTGRLARAVARAGPG